MMEREAFPHKTKALMSFISMKRMSLWCLIMKRKEIVIWIHVCPNSQTNFNSKKWWKEKCFLWNKSINTIYPMSWTSLWCLILKRKEITIWIHVCLNWQMNFDSKKWFEEKLFKWNQSINLIYPDVGNKFMVPNHEKKKR